MGSVLLLFPPFLEKKLEKEIRTFRGRPPGAPRVHVRLHLRLDHLRRPEVRHAEHELQDAVAASRDGDLADADRARSLLRVRDAREDDADDDGLGHDREEDLRDKHDVAVVILVIENAKNGEWGERKSELFSLGNFFFQSPILFFSFSLSVKKNFQKKLPTQAGTRRSGPCSRSPRSASSPRQR